MAANRPAFQCGGDYYDVLPIDAVENGGDKTFLLCVADVSGKGPPASLLMSNMQATLRALLGRVPTLVELATRTNELLHATTPSNKFVTAILLEIEPKTGAVRYVNAGHGDCMLLRSGGEAERLESTGLPLGMIAPEMLEMLGKGYEEKNLLNKCGRPARALFGRCYRSLRRRRKRMGRPASSGVSACGQERASADDYHTNF